MVVAPPDTRKGERYRFPVQGGPKGEVEGVYNKDSA